MSADTDKTSEGSKFKSYMESKSIVASQKVVLADLIVSEVQLLS